MLYGKKIGKVPCCRLISYVVWKKNRKSSLLQSDFVCCMEKNRKSSLMQSDFVCCMEKNGKVPCCSLMSYVVWKKNRKSSLLQCDFVGCTEKNRKSSLLQSDFVCCIKKIGKVPCCSLLSYFVWKKKTEKFPAAV